MAVLSRSARRTDFESGPLERTDGQHIFRFGKRSWQQMTDFGSLVELHCMIECVRNQSVSVLPHDKTWPVR